ncbi:hypothetical protein MMF93_07950 [Streptomyces tubbatahanensis]|uniref:SprT-like domain-containing protein n=1 Tax=Streptomyces tubbatahanensis TaxID=2923272 RepID=A0ABY3XPX1_9ACTN|nr:hypothetical protein [Streptomyces tubbatahanensis]UNS96445.1 hypothetical protein MMF93_07950 [Streptomyces tubbatahanensis]
MSGSVADRVERGFPHLETVRAALTALYRRLSADGVRGFGHSVAPGDVAFSDTDDLYPGVQRVAGVMVDHLRLPAARVIVSFREMTHAANVELSAGPEYFVELNDRFKRHRGDIGAALAHEVTHVWLHRLGLAFPGTRDNEILTDTAATYLGAGWLLLDAFRQDALTSQKLGYLTPEEFGYVLAKRARLCGEDPAVWFTSPQAYEAYERGRALAARDEAVPPLAAAPWWERRRYVRERRRGEPGGGQDGGGYAFEADGSGVRVSFPCPTCRVRLRVPARGRVRARCGLCGAVWACDT